MDRTKVFAFDQTAIGRALMVYSVCLLATALSLAPRPGHTSVGIASVAVSLVYLVGAIALVHERPVARWLITVAAAWHLAIAFVWASRLGLLPAW